MFESTTAVKGVDYVYIWYSWNRSTRLPYATQRDVHGMVTVKLSSLKRVCTT